MPKTLLPDEALRMERARILLDLREKELALVAERRKGCDYRQQACQLMITNLTIDRRDLNDEHEKTLAKKLSDQKTHEEFLATVRERLGLLGAFGFNPDTLEIVEN